MDTKREESTRLGGVKVLPSEKYPDTLNIYMGADDRLIAIRITPEGHTHIVVERFDGTYIDEVTVTDVFTFFNVVDEESIT